LIVHPTTIVTDVTQTVFAVGFAKEHPRSTVRTIIHDIDTRKRRRLPEYAATDTLPASPA
jgi:hypothetical protein